MKNKSMDNINHKKLSVRNFDDDINMCGDLIIIILTNININNFSNLNTFFKDEVSF